MEAQPFPQVVDLAVAETSHSDRPLEMPDSGRVLNHRVIAPTTWDFSPRNGTPVAPGEVLVGTFVGPDGNDAVVIQHVVRSFGPCMIWTVH